MDTHLYLNNVLDLDQLSFKMEERLICKKCMKGFLMKEILYGGIIFSRTKTIILYCPYCDFRNSHKFKLNESQYQKECE